ncbi:hypothetical protein KY326_00715 [Candidatus Woesearchaeota archaeon]|nr:hypothetical protein [Candidatus Woesearchaeota archaeon]
MAEKLTFKDKVEKIKKNKQVKNKDNAINKLISDTIATLKGDDVEKFLQEIKEAGQIEGFIGEPLKKFSLVYEKYQEQIEPLYFWFLGFLKDSLKIKTSDIKKLVDTYSASEASAFHKHMGTNIGAIQDRISNSLITINRLVRQDLFKMIREIGIITDRLEMVYAGGKFGAERPGGPHNAAEIAMKDMYINLVEGGSKAPGSVYGLGSQVGFITLPDLFLHTHIFDKDKVESVVDGLGGVSPKVKEVLGRKLKAYAIWRKSYKSNLERRRKFMLAYLKQYYNNIMLQIQWMKPYLQMSKRMNMRMDIKETPDILAAIEQTAMEIELLIKIGKSGNHNTVVVLNLYFRTSPETEFSQKYQAPTTKFMGRTEISLKSYALSDAQVKAYEMNSKLEDYELLDQIGGDIKDSLESFGDELKIYLAQANKVATQSSEDAVKEAKSKMAAGASAQAGTKVVEKQPWWKPIEPFVMVPKGFIDIIGIFITFPKFSKSKEKKPTKAVLDKQLDDAKTGATGTAWLMYNLFKKSHRMISW